VALLPTASGTHISMTTEQVIHDWFNQVLTIAERILTDLPAEAQDAILRNRAKDLNEDLGKCLGNGFTKDAGFWLRRFEVNLQLDADRYRAANPPLRIMMTTNNKYNLPNPLPPRYAALMSQLEAIRKTSMTGAQGIRYHELTQAREIEEEFNQALEALCVEYNISPLELNFTDRGLGGLRACWCVVY
jgi:hypothetical protein